MILCRHGQTKWNVEKRQQGSKDSPLTNLGIRQAGFLGRELESIGNIENIYSSPILRAYNTATIVSIILEMDDSKLHKNELLKECSFGIFEGKSREERSQEPFKSMLEERTKTMNTKYNWRYPKGENYADVYKRVSNFFLENNIKSKDVIIAHEAINRMILKFLGNISIEDSMRISQPNDVIYRIENSNIEYKKIGENIWNEGLLLNEKTSKANYFG